MLDAKDIEFLVIHCSDTSDDKNLNAKDIHKMHLSFGWNGIGYHKVILRSGEIQNGRPEFWIGAHVRGNNHISLGVCLIGRSNFTNQQFSSLLNILNNWKFKYPRAKILGHCNFDNTNKTCPNFNVKEWCENNNL